MRLVSPLVLFLVPMIHAAACTAPAPTPNPDIGRFEAAPSPVELPTGVELGDNAEFGYVTVPERHAHPEGPVIQIAARGTLL